MYPLCFIACFHALKKLGIDHQSSYYYQSRERIDDSEIRGRVLLLLLLPLISAAEKYFFFRDSIRDSRFAIRFDEDIDERASAALSPCGSGMKGRILSRELYGSEPIASLTFFQYTTYSLTMVMTSTDAYCH